MRILVPAALAVLLLAAGAQAGGFATVGIAPLPSGDEAVWAPTLTVKAHGRTPVDGVQPVISIWRQDEPSQLLEVAATPTGRPGEYAARVEWPGPGVWSYAVHDGYSQTHTYKPVEITAGAVGRTGASVPWAAWAAAVLAAALVLALLVRRLVRPSPQPA